MEREAFERLLVGVGDPVVHRLLGALHERVMTLEAAWAEALGDAGPGGPEDEEDEDA